MAITKYIPAQFRDLFSGGSKISTISVTPSATASGSFSSVQSVGYVGVQPGDVVFADLATPVAGVKVEGHCTAAGEIELFFFNISGASFGGAPLNVKVSILRPRLP